MMCLPWSGRERGEEKGDVDVDQERGAAALARPSCFDLLAASMGSRGKVARERGLTQKLGRVSPTFHGTEPELKHTRAVQFWPSETPEQSALASRVPQASNSPLRHVVCCGQGGQLFGGYREKRESKRAAMNS